MQNDAILEQLFALSCVSENGRKTPLKSLFRRKARCLKHLFKKLIFLSLKDCINLRDLPIRIELESLQILTLSGCSKLRKFP